MNHRDGDTQSVAMGGHVHRRRRITEAGVGEDFKEEMANCVKCYKEVKASTYREEAIVLVGKFPHAAVGKASSNIH